MSTLLLDYVNDDATRTVVTRDNDGHLIFTRHQDFYPFAEWNKGLQAVADRYYLRKHNTSSRSSALGVRVASIPPLVYAFLQRVGITRDPKLLMEWLSLPENRVFRTDDGRRITMEGHRHV